MILDEGGLVWIAAAAARRQPEHVLAGADMGAFARLTAAAEAAAGPLDEAATLLVGIAADRPFPEANRAAAWLAAAYVLAAAGEPVRLRDDDVVALVGRAERGDADVAAVATALGAPSRPRRLPWPCPACGRALSAGAERPSPITWWAGSSSLELTARCWAEHRAHDRRGRPLAAAAVDDGGSAARWRPVVLEPGGRSLLVLLDARAVVLVGRGPGRGHDVHGAGDVDPAALAGRWDGLLAAAPLLGALPPGAVRWSPRRGVVDWHHLVASADPALAAALDPVRHAVPA